MHRVTPNREMRMWRAAGCPASIALPGLGGARSGGDNGCMCLVAFAWLAHPSWRLVLAGNRDEFHARPAAPLAHWDEEPGVSGGRDLEAGGMWLGVDENGRAGVVTNVRDPQASRDGRSRGDLLVEYLRGRRPADEHAAAMTARAAEYRPFNLVLFDPLDAAVITNHPNAIWEEIRPGVQALSNGAPNAVWPKTRRLRAALTEWLAEADAPLKDLFTPLADETIAPDAELPDTGVGLEVERRLSPAFIRGKTYGTRASTLLAIAHSGEGFIIERRFGPDGRFDGETTLRFEGGPVARVMD